MNNHAHVLQGKQNIADNQFLAFSINRADIESLLVGGGRAKLNAETMMDINSVSWGDTVQITMGQSPDGSTYSDVPSDYILSARQCRFV